MNPLTHFKNTRIVISFTFGLVSLAVAATGFSQGSRTASHLPQPAAPLQYRVIDLGGPMGTANAINDSGRIIGSIRFPGGNRDAAFWPNPQSPAIDLGTLPGFAGSRGLGINAYGQMVGLALPFPQFSQARPVFWESSQSAPVELTVVPSGFFGLAPGINAAGQIVGTIYSANTQSAVFWPNSNAAPIYLTQLSNDFPFGGAFSVNAAGNIFGDGCDADFVECHALFWASSASAPVALAAPGGEFIYTDVGGLSSNSANGLNNAGGMVGLAYNADFSETRAVFWANSSSPAVILNTSGDFSNGTAESLNENGQIVGTAFDSDFEDAHAFLWPSSNSPGIDLNTLIPSDSGWELQAAHSINNRGEIAGQGVLDGFGHAFVLIPVREPLSPRF
jgi:probable HAF family extracellular repeat protein